ncbi:MAG: hypothetical protein WC718_05840 [Phycisphaerales bacterium]|jgi:hypothetical protein
MRSAWLAAVCVILPAVRVFALGGIFDIAGKAPTRAVVTVGEELPELPPPRSAMLDTMSGVVEELAPDRIVKLRACGAGFGTKPAESVDGLPRFCVVHCEGPDSQSRQVEILREAGGDFLARDMNDAKSKPVRLARDKFEALAADWTLYSGGFTVTANLTPGAVIKLPRPGVQGLYTMDQRALGKRFLNGSHTSIAGTTRDINTEDYFLRLPKGHDPRHASGLIVWVDAREKTDLDAKLFDACDALGFVLIGADNTGNGRPTAERYQMALDCVAIADRAFLIDPARVYLAGISGGGVISTHMWGCFPDVFHGAVPMAALGSYRDVPAGPGKVWKGNYQKPSDQIRLKLLKKSRIAVITGDLDFNHEPITGAAKLMEADGFPIKVWDIPGLHHEIAPAPVFVEALSWVDENARAAKEAREKAAADKLAALGEVKFPLTAQQREALVQITRDAPWSDAAWKAVEAMKVPHAR